MNIKPILIATAVALTSINANATDCWVEYDCGDGDIIDYDEIDGSSFTPPPPNIFGCSKPGYTFVGWAVSPYTDEGGDMNDLSSYEPMAYPGQTYNLNFAINGDTCNGRQHANSTSEYLDMRLTAQWKLPYNEADIIVPSSKSYVDSQINALQPKFSGLGANKLMTYGTTDGAVGSRDIVTELGNSKTANTIPTRGAIQTALDTKQKTMKGTAGWIATNTGTAGRLTQKPIYSTTNNYKTALVTAGDLNQIVTDAVNSELIRVDETGEPNANGTLWKLNDVANLTLPTLRLLLPDASINGTSYCYRGLSGTNNNGTCNAATLATLGTSGNKSAMWGVVFPYGDIVGKSVCGSQSGTNLTAATDAQESTLTTEFNAQSGVGTSALSDAQKYCWCKMESINGEPAVSRWVFNDSRPSASNCAGNCASRCVTNIYMAPAPRAAMFNSVQ